MHMGRYWAAASAAAVLTGGLALAAPAAQAATFTDTAVQASAPVSCGGITVAGNDSGTLIYAATGTSVLTGSTLTRTGTGTGLVSANLNVGLTTFTLAQSGGGSATFTLSLEFFNTFCGRGVTVTVPVTDTAGVLTSGTLRVPYTATAIITLAHPVNHNTDGSIGFSATSTAVPPVTVTPGNLPSGLSAANPLEPGTAVPGTYGHVTEVAVDGSGALAFGEFTLKVIGQRWRRSATSATRSMCMETASIRTSRIMRITASSRAGPPLITGRPCSSGRRSARPGGTRRCCRTCRRPAGASPTRAAAAEFPRPTRTVWCRAPATPARSSNSPAAPGSPLVNVATHLTVWPDGTGAQLIGGPSTFTNPHVSNIYTWTPYNKLPA